MFEDEYRKEMQDIHASESLIVDTLKKMQETSMSPSEQVKKPWIVKAGLPIAAVCILILVGVLLFPSLSNQLDQNSEQYIFQPVTGNTSISGGLQFGIMDEHSRGAETNLKRAECPERLLPKGILSGEPTTFGQYVVYLGFDESQQLCYAAYQEEPGDMWVVLQSDDPSETDFIEDLKNYFA